MEWKAKQIEFLTALEMGRNVYLSGKAGTGKTTIVNEARRRLTEAKIKYIAVAPTGRAATNIEGETIHSMFRVDPSKVIMSIDDCQFINKVKKQVISKAQVIFIDEGSMCRADLIQAMHWTLIKNGITKGLKGKQTVWIGDMKQLPPIASDNERSYMMREVDGEPLYNGITLFDAPVIRDLELLQIELDEVVRQNDVDFINALNIVRDGGKSEYFRQFISKEPSGIILAPRNEIVNAYNMEGLNAQKGKEYIFEAEIDGNLKPADYSLDAVIRAKSGCKIMYLVNSKDNPLRNGTLGELVIKEAKGVKVVTDPKNHKPYVELFFKYNGTEWPIELYTATKYDYVYNKETDEIERKKKGSITQYPFRLAYAMTIHKSQGMTFEDMTADFRGGCFAREQYYVALSRATGPKALRIII